MTEELSELSPFESAALTVQLRRLRGSDMLQAMRQAEPGWSDSTYYRRLNEALDSLERKGLATRVSNKSGSADWRISKEAAKLLSRDQLFDNCMYLGTKMDSLEAFSTDLSTKLLDLQRQLEKERIHTSTTQEELDSLKKRQQDSLESRLSAKFPGLNLSDAWIETLFLLALVEIMARHKLTMLQQGRASDIRFSDLFSTLKKVLPETEGRSFEFNKEILDVLYEFRNKMIHNGLGSAVRQNEALVINALVADIYQQLFEKTH
jgi:hypothetical protein